MVFARRQERPLLLQAPGANPNIEIDYRAAAANEAVRRRGALRGIMEDLRQNHECDHRRWRWVGESCFCEECNHWLPEYIFECKQCYLRVCNRCKRHRRLWTQGMYGSPSGPSWTTTESETLFAESLGCTNTPRLTPSFDERIEETIGSGFEMMRRRVAGNLPRDNSRLLVDISKSGPQVS